MTEDRRTRPLGPLEREELDADESVGWEIEHYIAERTDRLIAEGWDAAEAREEAERRFGSMDEYRPRMTHMERRRMRMERMGRVTELVRDAFAGTARTIRRSPGFAIGVVLTLGLGLGANAAMFGILDRLLLRPPDGIVEPEQVARVGLSRGLEEGQEPRALQYALTYPDVLDLEAHSGLRGVAAFKYSEEVTVGSGPEAESVRSRMVSHDFFDLLGIAPAFGRFPTVDEDRPGASGTVVLSWEYWQRRFGGDRGVLGQTLEVAGAPHTVLGVTPRGVTGVTLEPVDVWLPIEATQTLLTGDAEWRTERRSWWVNAVVRLAEGGRFEAADQQATRIYLNAGGDEPFQARRADENGRLHLRSVAVIEASDEAKVVKWLVGVSAIVLLIACANVANLFLARASRGRREVAVRLAMGVSRRRLVGQLALEAVLLAALGGAFAVGLAHWGGEGLRRTLLPNVLFADPVGARVLVFTAGISILAGLLAGIGPAFQATGVDLGRSLGEGARGSSAGRSRLRGALVALQTGLSVILLVGAGLFVKSLDTVRSLDLGLDVDRLVIARLEPTEADPDSRTLTELYREAAVRAEAVPGVESVGLTQSPLGWGFAESLRIPGIDSIPRMPGYGPYLFSVDPGYFEAVGLRIEEGRGFEPSDGEGAPLVAAVSRSMADSLWGGSAAIGQCMIIGRGDPEPPCTTVVGIVEEAARGGFQDAAYFGYYLPLAQRPDEHRANGLYVRASDDPEAIAGPLALALRSFSPAVRFARVQTLEEVLDPQARAWSLGATMFTLFGFLAAAVAAIGLYSILAFEVAERRRELGIRMALGADAGRLVRRVVGDATRLVALGLAAGLGAAWFLAPRIEELLFQVTPRDPVVLGAVAGLLLLVGVIATTLPARRATRVDPMEALREE